MEELYMFALVPPKELQQRIHSEREIFAEKYHCVKALKPPVHITLYEPFHATPETVRNILTIERWSDYQHPFTIELKNYSFFKHAQNPVVYIDVIKSPQLSTLKNGFMAQLRKHIPMEPKNQPYTPHITIGYRDIPLASFPTIVDEYSRRRFSASFECNSIVLWKHNRQNWQTHHEFRLLAKKDEMPTLF